MLNLRRHENANRFFDYNILVKLSGGVLFYKKNLIQLSLATILAFSAVANASNQTSGSTSTLPVCAYIASYAPGYAWQDGITRGIEQSLKGKCRLKTFYMNSKKVFDYQKMEKIALYAVEFIEQNKPDVVIVSDDNAIKYVLKDHYKESNLPVVFCGPNHTITQYQLPYPNTTGMIEKDPTERLLKLLFNLTPSKTHVTFLTTRGISADKDVAEFHRLVKKIGIKSSAYQIQNQEDWRRIYKQVQEDPTTDIIFFSNNVAFKEWDHEENMKWVLKHNHKLSITTQGWMMPYVALGMNKAPDEQGHWAGEAAIEILNGIQPSQLSIVPSQKFQMLINPKVAMPFKQQLPENIFSHASTYNARGSQ